MFYFLQRLFFIPAAVVGILNMNVQSGPFDIDVYKFEACEDPGTNQTAFSTRITKVSRDKYVYTGDVRFGPKFDEDFKVYLDLQKLGNQGYIPRYMEYTIKSCAEAYILAKETLIEFYKAAGVTVKGCPLPVGNFTVNNYGLRIKEFVPVMIYSKYRMILHFLYKNVKVGCFKIYGAAVPKNFTGYMTMSLT